MRPFKAWGVANSMPLLHRLAPRLHDDWRRIVRRSWSLRLALLSAGLEAADVGCSFLPRDPTTGRVHLATLAMAVSLAAALARLIPQKNMRDPDAD